MEAYARDASILVEALEGRSFVIFAGRLAPTSPLAIHADEAIIASGNRVDAQGSPVELAAVEHRFVARLHGETDKLRTALAARGASLELQGPHALLDLRGAVSTAELLGLCVESDVTVIELLPIARALA